MMIMISDVTIFVYVKCKIELTNSFECKFERECHFDGLKLEVSTS